MNENRDSTQNSTVFQTVGRTEKRQNVNRSGNVSNNGRNNRITPRQTNGIITRQRDPQARNRVVGTRQQTGGGLAAANQRDLDLFIGGCSLESSETDITDHCSSLGITQKSIVMLETKVDWYKAYKLTVCATDRDKLLEPSVWPEGVFVRKFFKARVNSQINS